MDISQEQLTAAMREAMKGVLVQGFPAIPCIIDIPL